MTGLTLNLTIPAVNTDWYGLASDDGQGETLREGAIDVWADLQAIKTTLEAADITSFDQMPTPLPSNQFVKTNSLGSGFTYSASNVGAHAAEHLPLGSDPLAGDSILVSYSGTNYMATASTVAGHLTGIDTKVAELDAINVAGQSTQGNLLTGTTPTAGGDIDLDGNNLTSRNDVALFVDIATSGNGACRVRGASANAAALQTDGAQANIDLILAGKGNGHPKLSHGGSVSRLSTVRANIDDLGASFNYTIVADNTFGNETDEGKTFICGGTGGTVNLPDSPSDGFTVAFIIDTIAFVTINRGGSTDMIVDASGNPGTLDTSKVFAGNRYSYVRYTYYSGVWFRTGEWS